MYIYYIDTSPTQSRPLGQQHQHLDPGSLLEMQILSAHQRFTKLGSVDVGSEGFALTISPRGSHAFQVREALE